MIEEYYNMFLPDITDLLNGNDDYLNNLLSCEDSLFSSCLMCVLMPIILYYGIYTKYCFWGYHFRVRHWAGWMIVSFVIMTTIAWLYSMQELEEFYIDETERIKWRLYWANVFLFIFSYIGCSWLWCQFLPTNAYRLFKFGH